MTTNNTIVEAMRTLSEFVPRTPPELLDKMVRSVRALNSQKTAAEKNAPDRAVNDIPDRAVNDIPDRAVSETPDSASGEALFQTPSRNNKRTM